MRNLAGLTLLTLGTALAQSRTFEVASVKPTTDECRISMTRTNDGLIANSNKLERLVEMAFQTKQIDLSRIPAALRDQCFDINAKAAQKITGDQHWEMLQALLVERFHLTFHREVKDAPVYVLTVAKPEGKLGPRLTESPDPDCPAVVTAGTNYCAVNVGPSMMIGQRASMTRIARELSVFAGRPILDQTSLHGTYDIQLSWTPDQGLSANDKQDGDKVKAAGIALDQSGASFFTAVEEQLGLKLQPQRGQIEILVIDHAEPPTQN
jgi:uncharacterized protein (TIGR03435 family)